MRRAGTTRVSRYGRGIEWGEIGCGEDEGTAARAEGFGDNAHEGGGAGGARERLLGL